VALLQRGRLALICGVNTFPLRAKAIEEYADDGSHKPRRRYIVIQNEAESDLLVYVPPGMYFFSLPRLFHLIVMALTE
jgi:hypothetical protein